MQPHRSIIPIPDNQNAATMDLRRIAPPWTYTALLLAVVAGAIAYYFVVALPSANRDRLQFERKKSRLNRSGPPPKEND